MRVDTKTKEEFIRHANNMLAFRDLEVLDVDWKDKGTKALFKIKVKCKKCGYTRISTLASLNHKGKTKCINCESYQIKWNNKRFKKYINVLYNKYGIIINQKSLNIKSSQSMVQCECVYDGFKWEDTVHNIINGHKRKCSMCNNSGSRYELQIKSFLDKNNIKYIREYSFNGFKTKNGNRKCRFDFYIPEYNMIIEMHGEQHYKLNSTFGSVDKERAKFMLKQNQDNDKRKMEYVLSLGIKYLAIKYDEDIIIKLKEALYGT